jgi:hypothetical protein
VPKSRLPYASAAEIRRCDLRKYPALVILPVSVVRLCAAVGGEMQVPVPKYVPNPRSLESSRPYQSWRSASLIRPGPSVQRSRLAVTGPTYGWLHAAHCSGSLSGNWYERSASKAGWSSSRRGRTRSLTTPAAVAG